MILTFSSTRLVFRIAGKSKIHTIREDKARRWKPGMAIHFWSGNPRNVHRNPRQFAEGICTEVKEIEIKHAASMKNTIINIDGKRLTWPEMLQLARNDGFVSLADFLVWFNEDFKGVVIHWNPNELKLIS